MRSSISRDELRAEFPILRRYIYLDHAATGPLPLRSVAKMTQLLERMTFEVIPPDEAFGLIEATRRELARLVGCSVEEIALIKNTTAGLLIAIGSIEFQPGDNVILQQGGFPANQYPWHYLLPQVEKRYLDPGQPIPEQLDRLIDGRTRAVSVDLVDYLTGIRIDLEEIRELLPDEVYLITDGIQAIGAVAVDLGPVDFLTCGSGKWLLSPQGTGFLYVKREKLDRLRLTNIGWLSSEWKGFTELKIRPIRTTAARFEEGTPNLVGLAGMGESVRMLNSIGIEVIESSIRQLTRLIKDGVDREEFEVVTPRLESGIVTLRPKREIKGYKERLDGAGIIVSERMGCLRISPHFYNTEAEIERLIEVLNRK